MQLAEALRASAGKETSDCDRGKLAFTAACLGTEAPCDAGPALQCDTRAALEWVGAHSAAEVREWRELAVQRVEQRAAYLWQSGAVDRWGQGLDSGTQRIVAGVCGPLLHELATAVEYEDMACLSFFTDGAPLLGELEPSGIGLPEEPRGERLRESELMGAARERNLKTLSSLRADPHEEALWDATVKDAGLGRMDPPVAVSALDLDEVLLIKRFGVAQGAHAASRALPFRPSPPLPVAPHRVARAPRLRR